MAIVSRASRWVQRHAWDLAIVVVLAALPRLFLWRLFTSNPADQAIIASGDFTDIMWPNFKFFATALQLGESPFWNPFVVAGHSAVGDIQYQLFYPLKVLAAWLGGPNPTVVNLELFIAIHLSLAGVFTYLFARRVIPGRLGPMVAAIVFTYGSYLTSFPIRQSVILEVSIWLPATLLLLDIAIVSKRRWCFALASITLAVSFLAGHPQTFVYLCLISLAYALMQIWRTNRKWTSVGLLVGTFALAMGLAAIQLLPFIEHFQYTARSARDFAFARTGFALKELTGVILPTVQIGGTPLYVGTFSLLLALWALGYGKREKVRWLWGGLAFAAICLTLGGNAFVQPAGYASIPFFGVFRDHERAAFIFSFSMAVLAGYGAADIRLLPTPFRDITGLRRAVHIATPLFAIGAVVSVVLAAQANPDTRPLMNALQDRFFVSLLILVGSWGLLLALSQRSIRPSWSCVLIVGLIAFDLFTSNWQASIEERRPDQLYPDTEITKLAQERSQGGWRVSSEGLLPGGGNAGSIYSIWDVVGDSPLEMDAFHVFDDNVEEVTRWGLLSVNTVVTKRTIEDPRLQMLAEKDGVRAYALQASSTLPRVRLVNDFVVAQSPSHALEATKAISSSQVVLSEPPPIAVSSNGEPGSVELTRLGYGRIEARVRANSNAILVVSETYHPGWEARVDGAKTSVIAADYTLMAIAVPAGEHSVVLEFAPKSLTAGIIVSIACGVALVGILALAATFGVRRVRRAPSERRGA